MVRVFTEPLVTQIVIEFFGSVPTSDTNDFAQVCSWIQRPADLVILSFYNVADCPDMHSAMALRDLVANRKLAGTPIMAFLYGKTCHGAYAVQNAQSRIFMQQSGVLELQRELMQYTPEIASLEIGDYAVLSQQEAAKLGLIDGTPAYQENGSERTDGSRHEDDLFGKLKEIFGNLHQEEEEDEENGQ